MTWRVIITPAVQVALRTLSPQVKRYVRQALHDLPHDPHGGKPLRDELTGLLAVRAKRFRVVYQRRAAAKTVIVVAVGPRDTIYEDLSLAIRGGDLVLER